MLPLLLKSNLMRFGAAAAPLAPRIESEIQNRLGFIDASLDGRDYNLGNELSAADIQLSFVGELGGARTDRTSYPRLDA